jgi:hypothetical protein
MGGTCAVTVFSPSIQIPRQLLSAPITSTIGPVILHPSRHISPQYSLILTDAHLSWCGIPPPAIGTAIGVRIGV